MNLPDPPFVEHLLYEQPWPLVIALLVAALVVLYVNRLRRNRKAMIVGALLAVAAGGVYALAMFVTTHRERLIDASRELVDGAMLDDLGPFKQMFTPTAVLAGPDGDSWLSAAQLFVELDQARKKHQIVSQSVRSVSAEYRSPDDGRTAVQVRTALKSYADQPVNTRWLFTWKLGPDGQWRIVEARFMQINLMAPTNGMWR